jgi:hypothetical protein
MKRLLQFGCVAAALLSAAMPARAQSVVCKGPVEACARATDAVRLYLALQTQDRGAVAEAWRWVLLDEDGWSRITETFREQVHLEKITGSAFTVAAIHTTYIHLGWFSAQFPSRQIETVTHELAHIAGCGKDEGCAKRNTQRRLEALLGAKR